MKKIIIYLTISLSLFLWEATELFSQNVGINSSGSTPNVSALLDIDATGMSPQKGLLIPRVPLTSITDAATIATPANTLLVYNTGAGGLTPAGYYYNQGTTGSPNWVPFLTNNVNTPSAWSLTGNTGTTASTSAIGVAVNNNFIGTTDTKDFVFASNNLERMRVASNGNVGIGIAAPTAKLHIDAGSAAVAPSPTIALTGMYEGTFYSNGGIRANGFQQAGPYGGGVTLQSLYFNGTSYVYTDVLNVTGLRNVGIGTEAPNGKLEVVETSVSDPYRGLISTEYGAISATLVLKRANGTPSAPTAIQNGNSVGSVKMVGYGATAFSTSNRGAISFIATENWTDAAQGNAIALYTTTNTTAASVERVRIDHNGNVGIGTASPSNLLHIAGSGNLLNLSSTTNGGQLAMLYTGKTAGAATYIWVCGMNIASTDGAYEIYDNNNAAARIHIAPSGNVGIGTTVPGFKLDINGSANCATNTWTSDFRKKKDIQTLNINGLEIINKLRPVTFEWKEMLDDGMKGTQMGFIAQELEKILPSMVVTANNEEKSKSVKYNEMLPILVEAIKEQQEQMEQLKTENENLMKHQNNAELEISELKKTVEQLAKQIDTKRK